jgi:hypothetical protein
MGLYVDEGFTSVQKRSRRSSKGVFRDSFGILYSRQPTVLPAQEKRCLRVADRVGSGRSRLSFGPIDRGIWSRYCLKPYLELLLGDSRASANDNEDGAIRGADFDVAIVDDA